MNQDATQTELETVIVFELPWPPVTGNQAVRHTGWGVHYKTAQSRRYETLVAQIVAGMGMGTLAGKKPLSGPLIVSWLLCPPDARSRDLDNLRKVVADALTRAGFWADDSNKVIRREVFDWTSPERGGAIQLTVQGVA